MIASPHFSQTRLVIWFATSSRLANEARAVFESSPFFAMNEKTPFAYLLSLNIAGTGDIY